MAYDSRHCNSDTVVYTYSVAPLDVEEFSNAGLDRFLLYPNPTDGFINISDTYDHYFLYNLSGKLMTHGNFNTTLDFRTYPKGIYLLNLQRGLNLISQKILIEK